MKKVIFLIAVSFAIISCSDSGSQSKTQTKLQKEEMKLEELKCRAEFSKQLLDYENTTIMVASELPKEFKEFQKLQTDSTVTCDSLKNTWENLCEKARN